MNAVPNLQPKFHTYQLISISATLPQKFSIKIRVRKLSDNYYIESKFTMEVPPHWDVDPRGVVYETMRHQLEKLRGLIKYKTLTLIHKGSGKGTRACTPTVPIHDPHN